MKHSCGAILYTISPWGEVGVILGKEHGNYLQFKGCTQPGETKEQTAIREIYEETCGLVKIDKITLYHVFNTKHKHYHIGLCYVPYNIIYDFPKALKTEKRHDYLEKTAIRFFPLTYIRNKNIHKIAMYSIKFYWNVLMIISNEKKSTEKIDAHARLNIKMDNCKARSVNRCKLPWRRKIDIAIK